MKARRPTRPLAAAIVVLSALLQLAILTGCGSDATQPASKFQSVEQVKPDLNNADERLKDIFAQANELLPGGRPAYSERIDKLKGLPIVVNKWGSWCPPCRKEFPHFQEVAKQMGGEVAFLGVNVSDAPKDASEFLRKWPVPYPSYSDHKLEISALMPPVQGAPTTAFYNADGKRTYVKVGEYKSARQLRDDIERYAIGQA